MGTHISRVKSVDLDAWTDEQLQSILSWGNARANKYWEAKLAAAHVPSESKIENFIRTKYELKRWVMDGPIPDPATLDADGDDDMPLSVVKEKHNVQRRESIRKSSVGATAAPQSIAPPPDLMGGDPVPPPRANTAGPPPNKVPPKAQPAPPKPTSTRDSLLGLSFLGDEPAAPPRPASTTGSSGTAGQSRPDLKQSILSLYATAPRPQPQQQPQQAQQQAQQPFQTHAAQQGQGSFGGLDDAFSGLSFTSSTSQKSPQNDAFASLGSFSSSSRPAPQSNTSAFSNLSGGSFFNPKPTPTSPPAATQSFSSGNGLGGFASMTTTAAPPKPASQPASSGLEDLFDFSTPAAPAPGPAPALAPKPAMASPTNHASSVFNLSSTQGPKPPLAPAAATTTSSNVPGTLGGSSNWSGADVWGDNAWSNAGPAKKSQEAPKPSTLGATNDFGWGSSGNSLANQPIIPGSSGGFAPAPKVAADEEFGGWTSSAGPAATSAAKPASGAGGNEDLFSNVWQ